MSARRPRAPICGLWLALLLPWVTACDDIDLGKLVLPLSPLMRMEPEPAGSHCPLGGTVVRVGLDLDGDEVLSDAEVTETRYTCLTPTPEVLVRVETVPPSERCAKGGQVSRAGRDLNGDGVLDDAEISREVYTCAPEGSRTVLTRVREGLAPGAPCSQSATLVDAGLDLDEDGQLSDFELRTTLVVCFGPMSHVVLELHPEGTARACPAGGTRVIAALDLNGNGRADLIEPQAYDFVCDEHHTFDGSYYAHDAVDLAALQGVSRIRGSLVVEHPRASLVELSLPALEGIDGDLSVRNSTTLERVDLPRLRGVGGDVNIEVNGVLTQVALGLPQRLPVFVGGSLNLNNNAALPDLEGFTYLVPRKSVVVSNNRALTHAEGRSGLMHVEQLAGQLSVHSNPLLERLPLPNLARVGSNVTLEYNAAMRRPVGTRLANVGGSLLIQRNGSLESLGGLDELANVDGELVIHSNDVLPHTMGLKALRRVGTLRVTSNPLLTDLGDMDALQVVDRAVIFEDNPALRTLRGLRRLTDLDTLSIGANPMLVSLSGLSNLVRTGTLTVSSNDSLAALSDLAALRELGSLSVERNANLLRLELPALVTVNKDLSIRANARLPACQVRTFAEHVFTGPPDGLFLEGNDDTAPCP
ncbi:hypothetical protein LZ198_17590 [Myxococcus sp. K15C18031901]|uniref:DUF7151 family protein n=1 Tax=Myxococcus dinghuensis TaxID=2906761 RepID=UPI0020A70BA0|nr:hypothetical protein [Myxococcus dinghuensis]MCP3100686.1 hypothetical protein [Myxococcus dinghuensis]